MARAIFSPRMIVNGELQPETFRLRSIINEEYLSVMRMSIPSWTEDIKAIPQRKNRKLFGYAKMNVGDIRNIHLEGVTYNVEKCDHSFILSHAGIFITVRGEKLIGGLQLKNINTATEQDYLVLAIQRELLDLAQKSLHIL